VRGRLLDLGTRAPAALHAAYAGLAAAQPADARPLLVLARGEAHLSIGSSQRGAPEIDWAACRQQGVGVLRRWLGGGTVWIDPGQLAIFVILPSGHAPARHRDIFDACLAGLVDCFADWGLEVERAGAQDLWLGGRKILGSGAATIARSAVFGTSLLERFDVARFAALVHAPRDGFRAALHRELRAGMTDLAREGIVLGPEQVMASLSRHLAGHLGLKGFSPDVPSTAETAAIAAMLEELADDPVDEADAGARRVADGIKLRHGVFLLEPPGSPALRFVLDSGRLRDLECAEPAVSALEGEPPQRARLAARLREAGLADAAADALAGRIEHSTQQTGE
jgi:lipoate-protein ligase A